MEFLSARIPAGPAEWISYRAGDADEGALRLYDARERREKAWLDGAAGPAWSPGGDRLAFTTSDGLFVASPGSAPRRLAQGPASTPEWSPDGRWVAFATPGGLLRARVADGWVRPVEGLGAGSPAWSGGW